MVALFIVIYSPMFFEIVNGDELQLIVSESAYAGFSPTATIAEGQMVASFNVICSPMYFETVNGDELQLIIIQIKISGL
jgi:hypothetical protein